MQHYGNGTFTEKWKNFPSLRASTTLPTMHFTASLNTDSPTQDASPFYVRPNKETHNKL